ncbi:MAG: hypothetical protein IPP17_25560 [Bacteroidetes bacterium]|nr:hypothetical protein [Bacteroidota bacterium]
MATHRYLQPHPEAVKVTQSAPTSGAYDLGGVQGEVIRKPYEYPGYFPLVLFFLPLTTFCPTVHPTSKRLMTV